MLLNQTSVGMKIYRRGGTKKRWSKEGREGEEQRRRSPRLCGSTSSSNGQNGKKINKHSKNTSTNKNPTIFMACHATVDLKEQDHGAMNLNVHSSNDRLQSPQSQEDEGQHDQVDESWLPEKRLLEIVLDTLQRRDTYEIFAEPVDPSEVEEYYEIIKEPMDFGTMRAKLHEGMYKSLQQFKYDVFLIFGNAIHFNSSGTVYFRQARALEELAKRVFEVLRTDPKNLELEFAATRRRSSRGIHAESKDSNLGSCRKLDKDSKSNNMTNNIGKRGCRRERRNTITTEEVDRRSTYQPWTLLDQKRLKVLSPIHHEPRSLIHVNKGDDFSYKKSLILFVKDLGPTAQKVAKRKLKELHIQALAISNANNFTLPDNKSSNVSYKHIDLNKEGINEGSNRILPLGFSRFMDNTSSISRGFSGCGLRDEGGLRDYNGSLVGKIDLNQVQYVSSDSSLEVSRQFMFDLPYLQSRMREVREIDDQQMSYYNSMGSHAMGTTWFM